MRAGIFFTVSPTDRARLMALIRGRNRPQKHVWRAEIVLLSADGIAVGREVAERVGALTLQDPPGETTHWTADPDKIIAAVKRGAQALDSIH